MKKHLLSFCLILLMSFSSRAQFHQWAVNMGGSNTDYGNGVVTDAAGNVYVTGYFASNTVDFDPGPGTYTVATHGGQDIFISKYTAAGSLAWVKTIGGNGSDEGHAIAIDPLGNICVTGIFNQTLDFDPGPGVAYLTGMSLNAFILKLDGNGDFVWAKSFDGLQAATPLAITTDASGNVYSTGYFYGTIDMNPGAGTNTVTAVSADIYISKLDVNGDFVLGKTLAGPADERASGIAADNAGNIYLVGTFDNSINVDPNGGAQTLSNAGSGDAFILKLTAAGNFDWVSHLNSTGYDTAYDIVSDAGGNIYATGSIGGAVDFQAGPGTYTVTGYSPSAYVAKFNSAGTVSWAKVTGPSLCYGNAIALDAWNNICVSGIFYGTVDFDPGSAVANLSSSAWNVYVQRLNNNGDYMWAGSLSNSIYERVNDVAADMFGNIFTTGYFGGTMDADPSAAVSNITSNGNDDMFLSKICTTPGAPANTTAAAGLSVCVSNSVVLSVNSSVNVNWYASATSTAVLSTGTSYTTPALAVGIHTFFAEAVSSCTNSATRTAITVTADGAPTPPINVTPIINQYGCAGSNGTLSATGTGTIYWYSNSSATLSVGNGTNFVTPVLGGGGFTYFAEAATACGTSPRTAIQIAATTPTAPANTTPAGNLNICAGNTTTLTASSAFNINWFATVASTSTLSSGNSFTVPVLAAGVYTYYAEAASNCTTSAARTAFTFTVNALPIVTFTANPSTICAGAASTLTASGANTYSWSSGQNTSSVTANPTSNTTYTVTGTDLNGCKNTAVKTLTLYALPNVTVTASSNTLCAGSTLTLTGAGANTYNWSTAQTTTVITAAIATNTTYTVTGTDANGCKNTAVKTITVYALPTVSISANTTTVCAGQSTTLTASGAASYSWSTTQTGSVLNVTPGSTSGYTVTGTDVNGCKNVYSKTITVNTLPIVNIAATNTAMCLGQTATLTASGAATYSWSTTQTSSAIAVAPAATSGYTVTGTDANGCQATATRTIVINTYPFLSIAGNTTVCEGESTNLTASGANTYTWNTGSTNASISVSPLTTTTLIVYGTNTANCTGSYSQVVHVNAAPSLSLGLVITTSVICPGTMVSLTAEGANTYTWSNAQTGGTINVSPNVVTDYTVTATGSNGCKTQDNITVYVNPLPIINISSSNPTLCVGQSATLTASGADSYVWGGSATGSDVVVSPNATIAYTVVGQNISGCVASASFTQEVTSCTSIKQQKSSNASLINVYPNPTNGLVTLNVNTAKEFSVEVYNALGGLVMQHASGFNNMMIDLSNKATGVYTIIIKDNGNVLGIKKLIKQ